MNAEEKITDLEKRLTAVEARNKKVEADKAWETSWLRKILVGLLTYFVVVLFFKVNNFSSPWKNAIVPTLGFLLSTLTLNFFKENWIKANSK